MPIVIPQAGFGERLGQNLSEAGVPVLSTATAAKRDIRPARIGLLNLMPAPAMEATEVQWFRWMGGGVLQIEVELVKFDDDERARQGSTRAELLAGYTPFSQVAEAGLDGLIVTGDNLEVEPLEGLATHKPIGLRQIRYAQKLNEVLDWANKNVPSSIYSCLGGHYALNHFHGLPREIDPENGKTLGVYSHDVKVPDDAFVRDMNDQIISPHARWGRIGIESIVATPGLEVLAASDEVGWLLTGRDNAAGGRDLFIQGHPEYYKHDLEAEYLRDRALGQAPPENYYEGDCPDKSICHTWVTDARALHANYINYVYEQFANPGQPRTA